MGFIYLIYDWIFPRTYRITLLCASQLSRSEKFASKRQWDVSTICKHRDVINLAENKELRITEIGRSSGSSPWCSLALCAFPAGWQTGRTVRRTEISLDLMMD